MPRILISGYYGFDNLGDDTVLYGIMSSIRKERPDAELVVLSNQPDRTEALFGIQAFNRWNFGVIFRELMRCDMLVMGGGSLLQDVTGGRSILYYLGIARLAKILNKPIVFYGQGIGPISKPLSERLIRKVVNHVSLITVRDAKSREDLQMYGVTRPEMFVTADPAFAINPELFSKDAGAKMLSEFGVQAAYLGGTQKIAGIAIRNWSTPHPFHKILAQNADDLIRAGWKVVFIPMQYPGDVGASQKVLSYMKERAVLLNRQFSFRDIANIIANTDLIIGMRLHSLILAAHCGVPFVSLSYDPKIDRFVQRVGYDRQIDAVNNVTYESLRETIQDCVDNLENYQVMMRPHVEELRKEAEKSGELAVRFLSAR
ncbi:polysaccharide pyruvyl transferase CsaB [Tumebacillus permanentifrigoris]|uniref:Polysaccharide pyruvyl transferase CsaB n=1 Tax=Tumebacillus permanentifrigoris TaxID=378543 RepID=A0A316DDB2_9BACL|nr:polysaccharide pyruvyl transferase CsaB [Tumebacillus permanentifrigoris]PWK16217.1 polysaccharide pyruvyl transferase CsaB [Tumebacillus permanentifrigoris]